MKNLNILIIYLIIYLQGILIEFGNCLIFAPSLRLPPTGGPVGVPGLPMGGECPSVRPAGALLPTGDGRCCPHGVKAQHNLRPAALTPTVS